MNRLMLGIATILAAAGGARGQDSRPAATCRVDVRLADDRGAAVPGVAVTARLPFADAYSEEARREVEAVSDASGVASFEALAVSEPVVFEVDREPWVPTRSPVVVPRPATNGGAAQAVGIVLTEGRDARIRVVDGLGAPVPDAEVLVLPLVEPRLPRVGRVEPDQRRGSVRTGHVDAAGTTAFGGLPAELLTFEVRSPLYETRLIAIDLASEPGAEAVVALDRDLHPPGPSMPWLPSVGEAFEVAEAGHLPVLVFMTMDGERANDAIATRHFADCEVVRAAELLPCLVSSAFGEGGLHAEGVPHHETEGFCSRYGSIGCAAHQAVEAFARSELAPDPESFHVPHAVLLMPDGRPICQRTFYLSERELRWMLLRALRACDSDAAAWMSVRRLQPLWSALCDEADSPARRSAVSTLARLANARDEYALALLQDFPIAWMPVAVRLAILDALLPAAIPEPVHALRGFLRDPEPPVRLRAWQVLRANADRVDLETAVSILAGEEDEPVLAAAFKTLRVHDVTIAVSVADAGAGERWRLVEMLLDTLDAAGVRGIDEVLERPATEGRNRVLRKLARIYDDESSARRVFGHASAPEAGAVAAIRALGVAPGGVDERARDLFAQQAKSPDALVRQEAVTQLGRHGPPAAATILAAALQDPVEPVRIAAAIGLWKLGDRSAARVLAEGIDDPELGDEARSLLEEAFLATIPKDAASWRKWLEEQGLLKKE